MDIGSFALGLLPSVLTAMIAFYLQRRQRKRDAQIDARVEARKHEGLLQLELQMATAKLTYAVAMAVKRGIANGEVEEGIEAFEQARRKYAHFLSEQAQEYLM